MKRSKKYAKLKENKVESVLFKECDRLIKNIIDKGEIKMLELIQALSIRTRIPYEDLKIRQLNDIELEKVLKELKHML